VKNYGWAREPLRNLVNAEWFAGHIRANQQLNTLRAIWKVKPPTTKMTAAEIESARKQIRKL
jgi:hypothetical protein